MFVWLKKINQKTQHIIKVELEHHVFRKMSCTRPAKVARRECNG